MSYAPGIAILAQGGMARLEELFLVLGAACHARARLGLESDPELRACIPDPGDRASDWKVLDSLTLPEAEAFHHQRPPARLPRQAAAVQQREEQAEAAPGVLSPPSKRPAGLNACKTTR